MEETAPLSQEETWCMFLRQGLGKAESNKQETFLHIEKCHAASIIRVHKITLTLKENLVLHVVGMKSVKGRENTMFNVSPQAAR